MTPLLLALTVLACTTGPADPPPTVPYGPELHAHMRGHLADLTTARLALVQGDLGSNKAAIQAFLDHKVAEGLPGDWFARVTAMGEAAQAMREAEDLPAAALATAQLAETCAACHTAVSAQVKLAGTPLPGTATSHADRYGWALDQLWLSLIVPTEDAWEAAAAELGKAASDDDALASGEPEQAEAWRRTVGKLGGPAPVMPRRVALAAEVLARCGACHAASGPE